MHSGSGPARCGTGPRAVGDALLELPARTPVCSCWFVLLVGFPIFARGGGQKSENRRARRTSLDTQGVRAGSSRRASSGARGAVLRRAGLEQECIMDAAGGSATARGRTHQSQEARQPERIVIVFAADVSLLFRCRAAVSLLGCCFAVVSLPGCCFAAGLLFRCRAAVSLLFRCRAAVSLLFRCCFAAGLLFRCCFAAPRVAVSCRRVAVSGRAPEKLDLRSGPPVHRYTGPFFYYK